MQSIEGVSKQVTKYVKTWEMLLFHCGQFAVLPLEQRKKKFTRPLVFLSVSLSLLYLVSSIFGYWLATIMNSDYPLSLRTAVSPVHGTASFVLQLVGVGLQAVLWYSVAHRWLGYRLAVQTPFPFRRIFNEVLYINTPITVITVVWFLGGAFILGCAVFYLLLPSATVIRDLPRVVVNLILVLVLCLTIVLLFGGFVIPSTYYNTIVMGRLPWSYGVATTCTIPRFLSDREVNAVRRSRAIASAENHHWEQLGSIAPFSELGGYVSHLPNDDEWKLKRPSQCSLVLNVAGGAADGYRFSVKVRRRAGVVYAVPETLTGVTRHVIMTEIESGITYVMDQLGPSEHPPDEGKRLMPIGLGDY